MTEGGGAIVKAIRAKNLRGFRSRGMRREEQIDFGRRIGFVGKGGLQQAAEQFV